MKKYHISMAASLLLLPMFAGVMASQTPVSASAGTSQGAKSPELEALEEEFFVPGMSFEGKVSASFENLLNECIEKTKTKGISKEVWALLRKDSNLKNLVDKLIPSQSQVLPSGAETYFLTNISDKDKKDLVLLNDSIESSVVPVRNPILESLEDIVDSVKNYSGYFYGPMGKLSNELFLSWYKSIPDDLKKLKVISFIHKSNENDGRSSEHHLRILKSVYDNLNEDDREKTNALIPYLYDLILAQVFCANTKFAHVDTIGDVKCFIIDSQKKAMKFLLSNAQIPWLETYNKLYPDAQINKVDWFSKLYGFDAIENYEIDRKKIRDAFENALLIFACTRMDGNSYVFDAKKYQEISNGIGTGAKFGEAFNQIKNKEGSLINYIFSADTDIEESWTLDEQISGAVSHCERALSNIISGGGVYTNKKVAGFLFTKLIEAISSLKEEIENNKDSSAPQDSFNFSSGIDIEFFAELFGPLFQGLHRCPAGQCEAVMVAFSAYVQRYPDSVKIESFQDRVKLVATLASNDVFRKVFAFDKKIAGRWNGIVEAERRTPEGTTKTPITISEPAMYPAFVAQALAGNYGVLYQTGIPGWILPLDPFWEMISENSNGKIQRNKIQHDSTSFIYVNPEDVKNSSGWDQNASFQQKKTRAVMLDVMSEAMDRYFVSTILGNYPVLAEDIVKKYAEKIGKIPNLENEFGIKENRTAILRDVLCGMGYFKSDSEEKKVSEILNEGSLNNIYQEIASRIYTYSSNQMMVHSMVEKMQSISLDQAKTFVEYISPTDVNGLLGKLKIQGELLPAYMELLSAAESTDVKTEIADWIVEKGKLNISLDQAKILVCHVRIVVVDQLLEKLKAQDGSLDTVCQSLLSVAKENWTKTVIADWAVKNLVSITPELGKILFDHVNNLLVVHDLLGKIDTRNLNWNDYFSGFIEETKANNRKKKIMANWIVRSSYGISINWRLAEALIAFVSDTELLLNNIDIKDFRGIDICNMGLSFFKTLDEIPASDPLWDEVYDKKVAVARYLSEHVTDCDVYLSDAVKISKCCGSFADVARFLNRNRIYDPEKFRTYDPEKLSPEICQVLLETGDWNLIGWVEGKMQQMDSIPLKLAIELFKRAHLRENLLDKIEPKGDYVSVGLALLKEGLAEADNKTVANWVMDKIDGTRQIELDDAKAFFGHISADHVSKFLDVIIVPQNETLDQVCGEFLERTPFLEIRKEIMTKMDKIDVVDIRDFIKDSIACNSRGNLGDVSKILDKIDQANTYLEDDTEASFEDICRFLLSNFEEGDKIEKMSNARFDYGTSREFLREVANWVIEKYLSEKKVPSIELAKFIVLAANTRRDEEDKLYISKLEKLEDFLNLISEDELEAAVDGDFQDLYDYACKPNMPAVFNWIESKPNGRGVKRRKKDEVDGEIEQRDV